MDSKHKIGTALAAGIASLAVIVGGAAIASGDSTSSSTAPAASPGAAPVQYGTPPQAAPDGGEPGPRGEDCPEKDGQGGGPGRGSSQQAPQAPSSSSTATPQV